MQKKTFVKQILNHILKVDLDIMDLQLQVTLFYLKHYQSLSWGFLSTALSLKQ